MGTFEAFHYVILAGFFGLVGYLIFNRRRSSGAIMTDPLFSAARQLSPTEQILLEQRVTNDGPSQGVAYVLWFALGLLSGHRFYLGRPGTAVLQILSYFVLIGFVWWIVDAFSIPAMIRERRNTLRESLALQMIATQQVT